MILRFNPSVKNGFSLLEIIVGLGIIGILGLILAQFSTSAIGMLSGFEKNNVITETMTEVRFTLANNRICNLNLGEDKHISFSVTDLAGVDIPKISSFDFINKTEAGTIVELNKNIRGVVVSKIKLIPGPKLSDALVLSDLQITFEKPNSLAQPITRSLPLLLRVQENEIKECWLRKNKSEVDYSQICSITTNGALNAIDSEGKCTLANGKWIAGSASNATCPTSATLPEDATRIFNCKATPAAGWIDTFASSSVTVTINGVATPVASKQQAWHVSLDKATKTCTCDWAEDIPDATVATFSCEILCLVP